jgi:hypothetical protein
MTTASLLRPAGARGPAGRRIALLAVVLLLPAVPRLAAQDTQYWSIQYGPVGQLVGGQLIGGVSDLSATFYNPGALSLRNESSYLLSTESFQWEAITTEAQPGLEVLDTSSSRLGAAPSLLAGVLPRWFGEETRLAWSFLTRQKLEVRIGQRLTDPIPAPGVSSAAESYLDQRVEEDWAGLTISHPVSRTVGLGATWYGVYRGQRTRAELSAHAVTAQAAALAASGVSDVEYSHYRTLAKLGVAWQTESWNAGVSITTPSLGAFGSGKTAYTLSVAGVDANGDGASEPPVLVTSTLEDLDSDYRSPWAVGAGVSKRVGSTRLYASAEWYGAVDRYTVIAVPEETPGASGLSQELRSVLNGGIGFERIVNDDISVYGAFHTDFSASKGGVTENVAVSDWDLYHLSGGLSFRFRDNRFTLGASWAFGGKDRPLESPIPPEDVPVPALGADVSVRYSKVTFLLGFVFGS